MSCTRLPETGDQIEVYWPDDRCYYSAEVKQLCTGIDSYSFRLVYFDGEEEVLNLASEVWRYLKKRRRSPPSSPVDVQSVQLDMAEEEAEESAAAAAEAPTMGEKLAATAVFRFLRRTTDKVSAALCLRQSLDTLLSALCDGRLMQALVKGASRQDDWLLRARRGIPPCNLRRVDAALLDVSKALMSAGGAVRDKRYGSDALHAVALVLTAQQRLPSTGAGL